MAKSNLSETTLAELTKKLRVFSKYWQSCHLECNESPLFSEFMSTIHKDIEAVSLDQFLKSPEFNKVYIFRHDLGYLEIYNDGFLVLMIMFLPDDYFLEFHDHPQMIVISKLLEGEMTLLQCDLLEPELFYGKPRIPGSVFAGRNFSQVLQKSNCVAELFPRKNNVHGLKSHKRSVVLDVVFNYYDENRPCSYFDALPDSNGSFSHLRFTKEE